MKLIRCLVMPLAVLALCLGGCGVDDSGGSSASTCQGNDACPEGLSCKPQYDMGQPWNECEEVGGAFSLCHVGDDVDCADGFYCAKADGIEDIKFGIGRCTAR